jgi:prepilin-type N-terminal cleavage/methylation domain-containing protein
MKRRNGTKKGFTIVELLTVMGVIALLIGLLVPALNIVRRIAKDTKQRAQFHSVEVALEIFKNDDGEYPPSSRKPDRTSNPCTTGAQQLAEALVGRDLQGYDPLTTWDAEADSTDTKIYASQSMKSSSVLEENESMQRRRKPYLKLEQVGAFSVDQLYSATGNIFGTATQPAPFIADVFADKQVTVTNTIAGVTTTKTIKAGTPILYYRANPSNKDLRRTTGTTSDYADCTYNWYDNADVLGLGRMMNQTEVHPMYNTNNPAKFYELISNPQVVATNEGVSYNADSFILMSAGKDGFFGTSDDIYNFGE